jgi:SAM-dependent methyltransferase
MSVTENQAKQLWADEADERLRYGRGFHWVESPIVQAYMNNSITGDPALNWVAYSVTRRMHGRVSPRVLSLGCGGGVFERDLLRLVPDAQVLAMDFSSGAIDLARQRASEAGLRIEYRVVDLNEVDIEPHAFDVVFAAGALHHIAALERLLLQVRDCLASGGILIANEYVGPNQLQWTDMQVRVINEILALLPDRYTRRISNPMAYKRDFPGPSPLEEMNRLDPTEAVHAEEIVPLVGKIFHLLEFKPFGGTILQMLLQDVVGNFIPGDEVDDCVLKLICHLEWSLITAGVLSSDFAYFVGGTAPEL